ncbi:unnamed protein product [Dovyalis caffra]|uniref:Sulfotransferase n=1 Tax=Dovyalis caffra TaxID=77055 RepID=A0AAV1QTF0_9ROSI|nr:unnamed protein product [Dovyalis caffra]
MTDASKINGAPKTDSKFEEIISNLPKDNGWKSIGQLYKYQGFWYAPLVLQKVISAQESFTPQPTDVVLCSSPKSGTAWLKALAFSIVSRNQVNDSTNPLLEKLPHEIVPFLEIELAQNSSNRNLEIPFVATHIPYTSLPKSIIDSGCKIIYICRDPKDVLISHWNFDHKVSGIGLESFPLEEALEQYCKGIYPYGPYWDHVLGFWKASLEVPEKVLFVKYEDLKTDGPFHVKRMAKFLGQPFSVEEEQQGVAENIVKKCSFETLSRLEVNKNGKYYLPDLPTFENKYFFRKGKAGDWKNYLTNEKAEKLDQIMEEKFSGSGLV